MDATGRTLALLCALRNLVVGRGSRQRPRYRHMPPPLPKRASERAAAPEPVARPAIAEARVWPPAPHRLGLEEFATLPTGTRALIAGMLEPACERLLAAVTKWLANASEAGAPERRIASAMAAHPSELVELIAIVDRYNIAPGSAYCIAARLKLFLVECAIAEVADCARQSLAEARGPAVAYAA